MGEALGCTDTGPHRYGEGAKEPRHWAHESKEGGRLKAQGPEVCDAPQWNVIQRGTTGGRWGVRRGAERPRTGGRAREKPKPRLVWSPAGLWTPTGQLAGNSHAAFRRCQSNQGQQSGIANQPGLAFKVQPASRKGEVRCEGELLSWSTRTGVTKS